MALSTRYEVMKTGPNWVRVQRLQQAFASAAATGQNPITVAAASP